MSILMTLRIAFKALGRNKLRTGLTMLGMIIGVAAVIAMVALGTGAQVMIEEQIKTQGTNLITVMAGSANAGGVRTGAGGNSRLVPEDAQRLRDLPEIEYVAESIGTRLPAKTKNRATAIRVVSRVRLAGLGPGGGLNRRTPFHRRDEG